MLNCELYAYIAIGSIYPFILILFGFLQLLWTRNYTTIILPKHKAELFLLLLSGFSFKWIIIFLI